MVSSGIFRYAMMVLSSPIGPILSGHFEATMGPLFLQPNFAEIGVFGNPPPLGWEEPNYGGGRAGVFPSRPERTHWGTKGEVRMGNADERNTSVLPVYLIAGPASSAHAEGPAFPPVKT